MSNTGSGNRLMSIHSMLGGITSNPHGANETSPSKMMPREDSRPSSVPVPHDQNRISPLQQGRISHNPIFRAHSQPPLPGAHEPPRFFNPQQNHEHVYNHGPPTYQHQHPGPPVPPQVHAHQLPRSSGGNGAHLQHPQPGHFHVNNPPITNHATYTSPSLHERERERDREREEERRRRERERLAGEVIKPQLTHFEIASRPGSRAHSRAASHHHHHVHHHHAAFKRPKITISSQKTFDEAKLYPEKKLGRWTYSPTERLPFKLSINATCMVHIPRRYLAVENNEALKRRKVWGSEIYTDDSDLVAVLTHSTSSIPTEGDIEMSIRIMPRLINYISSMSNEVRSRGWSTKHDGLSYYVEAVSSVSWKRESLGKGFLKRSLQEMQYLMAESEGNRVIPLSWSPQKFCKKNMSDGSADRAEPGKDDASGFNQTDSYDESSNVPRPVVEPVPTSELFDRRESTEEVEGDETIELSMEEPMADLETSSSFIEPQGPLILHQPEVLPTVLSNDTVVESRPQAEQVLDGRDSARKTESPKPDLNNESPIRAKEEQHNRFAVLSEPQVATNQVITETDNRPDVEPEVETAQAQDEATTTMPDATKDAHVEVKLE